MRCPFKPVCNEAVCSTYSYARHACADGGGEYIAVGTYELNTTDLCSCAGGTFVITAVFSDDSEGEYFGDSAATTNITVLPGCPPVEPLRFVPLAEHA